MQDGDAAHISFWISTEPCISFTFKTQRGSHTDTVENMNSANPNTQTLAVIKATELRSNKGTLD